MNAPTTAPLPPHSVEAEEYLLSCCLHDGDATIKKCIDSGLPRAAFYVPANALIYAKVCELHRAHPPVEVAVLAEELKAKRQLKAVGGFENLTRISGLVPTTAQAQHWLGKVREHYVRRQLQKVAQATAEAAADLAIPVADLVNGVRDGVEAADKVAARPAAAGFTVWRVSEFAQHEPPKDDAILGDGCGSVLWRDRQLMLLLGPGGVGKSRLRANLAFWQITGRGGLGFKTFGPPRKWLLTGNENSVRREKEALAAMLTSATKAERELLEEHLLIQALVGDEADSMSFDDPEALDLWGATAQKWKPDILGLDPWESVIIGGDCNEAAATRESVRKIRALFTPYNERFTPFIVHHAKEGAQAARGAEGWDAGAFAKGSKTLRSMARFVINVAPENPDDGGRVVLACGKINDGKKFVTRGAVLDEATHLYSLNHDFDLDAWRADVEGKNGGKSCSIRDVVEAVRSGLSKTGDIVERVRADTGACKRTILKRLNDAKPDYLQNVLRGQWTLGNKKLSEGRL